MLPQEGLNAQVENLSTEKYIFSWLCLRLCFVRPSYVFLNPLEHVVPLTTCLYQTQNATCFLKLRPWREGHPWTHAGVPCTICLFHLLLELHVGQWTVPGNVVRLSGWKPWNFIPEDGRNFTCFRQGSCHVIIAGHGEDHDNHIVPQVPSHADEASLTS